MRLSFITNEYITEPTYSGGLANYLGRITVGLVERGHEVHVLTRAQQQGQIDYRGVHVHRVVPLWDRTMRVDKIDRFVPRTFANCYQDVKAAWCLWRYWRRLHLKVKFDLVQIANVLAVGLFFRRPESVPVVVRMSSHREAWDNAAGTEADLGAKARRKLEEWAARGRNYIYAPSGFVARMVREAWGDNVQVIQSPFFPEAVACDESVYDRVLRDKPYALFFGRMTQMKGVHILAQALPKVLEAHPEMHMVLVGSDYIAPDGGSMKDYVREKTRVFADRVHLLDALPHSQLYPLIDHSRYVVLPSLIDNLPNTLLESMGHGKLAICTTGSCFEEIIEPGTTGILVPPGDADRLAEAMTTAWDMPASEREEFGRRAQERVKALAPAQAVPALLRYYEQVLGEFARGKC